MVVVTVLQRVVTLPVVLLFVFSTAAEVTRHHAFLAVVVVSPAVDGTGDRLFLILLTLL